MNNVIYISKRDEDVTCKIVKEMEVAVIIEYLTGSKSGQTTTISTGTLKRWWKKAEKPEVVIEPAKAEKPEVVIEPAKKSVIRTSKKVSKKSKAGFDQEAHDASVKLIESIVDDVTQYTLKYMQNVNCYKVLDTQNKNKTVAEVYPRRKYVEVRVKTVIENSTCEYTDGYKYYLPVHYHVNYSDSLVADIKALI